METNHLKKKMSGFFETDPQKSPFHRSNAKLRHEVFISHRIHGTGTFTYIYHSKSTIHV